jgi:hypothetical protein
MGFKAHRYRAKSPYKREINSWWCAISIHRWENFFAFTTVYKTTCERLNFKDTAVFTALVSGDLSKESYCLFQDCSLVLKTVSSEMFCRVQNWGFQWVLQAAQLLAPRISPLQSAKFQVSKNYSMTTDSEKFFWRVHNCLSEDFWKVNNLLFLRSSADCPTADSNEFWRLHKSWIRRVLQSAQLLIPRSSIS